MAHNHPVKNPEAILAHSGLRKTALRTQVLQLFLEQENALSSHQLEDLLREVDRVTLYRTLRTFEQKGIIHQAIDGAPGAKYALCHGNCGEKGHHDHHAHFHCNRCGKTICMDDIHQPDFKMPPGFELHSSHLALQGVCDQCARS
jgi:Fur family transcriptional regulator, ferric uptake regulator